MEELCNLLQPAVEKLPQIFLICRPDGNLIYISNSWKGLSGQEKRTGKEWIEQFWHEDQHKMELLLYSATENVTEDKVRIFDSDGKPVWFNIQLVRSCSWSGDVFISGIMSRIENGPEENRNSLRDAVQDFNLTLNQFEKQKQDLENMKSDFDGFIYSASHDLKAPVANIEALMDILKHSDPKSEDYPLIFKHIDNSLKKFKNTLQELSDLAKANLHDVVEEKEFVSLREIVANVLESISVSVQEADPEINLDLEIEEVSFFRKNLQSIIYNLLTNCIKYRHPERRCSVSIITRDLGDYILLIVKDNGIGIPEDKKNDLFQPFKRFHSHVEGTGVGLYIVRRLIEKGQGKIEAFSREGEGTEFKLYIPEDYNL